ncbi:MAG: hypothetical protein HYY05_08515 [Chloroflexi bacterium]|nr:hypothetical protein [Chloroflexota bacterium]
MTTVLPLGVIGVVMAFLAASLMAFPGVTAPEITIDETYRPEAVQETGAMFEGVYASVIEGLISHQKHPDYQKAEATSQSMTAYGRSLLPRLEELRVRLRSQLDDLFALAASLEEPTQ